MKIDVLALELLSLIRSDDETLNRVRTLCVCRNGMADVFDAADCGCILCELARGLAEKAQVLSGCPDRLRLRALRCASCGCGFAAVKPTNEPTTKNELCTECRDRIIGNSESERDRA